jgi:hypothetical protein
MVEATVPQSELTAIRERDARLYHPGGPSYRADIHFLLAYIADLHAEIESTRRKQTVQVNWP